MKTSVTQQDLLEAISDALSHPSEGDASTVAEIAHRKGFGEDKVRKGLKVLHLQGRLEAVQVHRQTISGVLGVVPAYRIKA